MGVLQETPPSSVQLTEDTTTAQMAELEGTGCMGELLKAEHGAEELYQAGFTLPDLRYYPGISLDDLVQAGFTISQLHEAGASLMQLEQSFPAAALRASLDLTEEETAILAARQLWRAGFTAKHLRQTAFSAAQLRQAGFEITDLVTAGFTTKQLHEAGFSLNFKRPFCCLTPKSRLSGAQSPAVAERRVFRAAAPPGFAQAQLHLAEEVKNAFLW